MVDLSDPSAAVELPIYLENGRRKREVLRGLRIEPDSSLEVKPPVISEEVLLLLAEVSLESCFS